MDSDLHSTKLMIVEKHTMIRQALSSMLSHERNLSIVGTASTLAEAKIQVSNLHPDLVLVDILLPDGSGVDLIHYIKSENPHIKTSILTGVQDEDVIMSAIEAGADGYITKNSSFEFLLDSIRQVSSGGHVYDPLVASPILRRIVRHNPELSYRQHGNVGEMLTSREREIVRLISKGLTNKEIAHELSISIHTAKTHVRKIFKRLNVSSRRELLANHHG